ncbi:MAG: type IX secretion system membrane protein PorP/SprF [Flavobacteriales bacterium]|nr:type IX secretion system membrane protein PorP/SprF [Flavobacteriales bacterium]
MKRTHYIIILSLLICPTVKAQQNPQFTNFLFNSFSLQPAQAGLNKCLDARVGYRNQWVGFENNPQTLFISAHQRIDKISREKGVIHGVGVTLEGDNTGFTSRTHMHAVYAIHLPITRKTRISFGLGLGALQYRFDASGVRVLGPNTGIDPVLDNSRAEFAFPDIKAGIWLYSKYWFAGLSGHNLTNPTFDNIGTDVQMQPHFNLMTGRIFSGGDKLSYIPALQFKFTSNSTPSLDVNFWADYDDVIALGVAFRSEDAAAAMLKFSFLDYFTVAYAYDITYSRVRLGSSNSHEIILGISACPRNQKAGFVPCNAYD